MSGTTKTGHPINPVCYFIFVLLGLYLSIFQSVISDITGYYQLQLGQAGLLIAFHFLGSFLIPPTLGEIGDRAGTKPVLQLAFVIGIAGLVLIIASKVPAVFFVGVLLVGGGFAAIEGMLSGLLAVANPGKSNVVMNISQMCFCLGAVCGPSIVFALKLAQVNWMVNYIAFLVLFILSLALLSRLTLPPYHTAVVKGLQLKHLLRDRVFVLLLLSIFLYVGIEEGIAFWVTNYVQAKDGFSAIPGLVFISVYWLGMAFGRFLFQYLRRDFHRWLSGGMIGAGAFMVLFLLSSHMIWILLCLFIVGFGMAPGWPVLIISASERGSESTNTAMGAMVSLGAVGGMAVPFMQGQIAQYANMNTSMLIMPFLLIILAGLAVWAGRGMKIRKPQG
jgi:MFS transporter, FHS family, glucose/mannose:H+ symporter